MEKETLLLTIAVLGGTGKEGKGLAYRWAKAGYQILIGSRSSEKAVTAASEIIELLEGEGQQHRAVSASRSDAMVRLWPALAAPADLCAKLTTNMSDKQCHDWISADIGYTELLCPGLPRAPD